MKKWKGCACLSEIMWFGVFTDTQKQTGNIIRYIYSIYICIGGVPSSVQSCGIVARRLFNRRELKCNHLPVATFHFTYIIFFSLISIYFYFISIVFHSLSLSLSFIPSLSPSFFYQIIHNHFFFL